MKNEGVAHRLRLFLFWARLYGTRLDWMVVTGLDGSGETLGLASLKIRDSGRRGEWAELRFMAKAMEHGYRLTKPWGMHSPYDLVIDLGGRFMSVQVKSTTYQRRRGDHQRDGRFAVSLSAYGRPKYGIRDFQYLAVYVIPRDVWYIIPFELVRGRQGILLRPDDPPGHGYERFREAWHLLREVPPPVKPWLPPVKHERYNLPGLIRRGKKREPGSKCFRD